MSVHQPIVPKPRVEATLPANIKTFVDLTTSPGVATYYVVTAMNAVGESPRSNEIVATPIR